MNFLFALLLINKITLIICILYILNVTRSKSIIQSYTTLKISYLNIPNSNMTIIFN